MSDDFEAQKLQRDFLYDFLAEKKAAKDPKILTKSKFLNGLQCPKLLWTRCNAPEQIPEPSESLQQVFNAGYLVGELATRRFPGGVYVQEEDFQKNLKETKELLASKNPRPIYEAGIMVGRLYARADILRPSGNRLGAWDVIEVKCGTKCKDVYLQDIAFQKYCYQQAGLTIDKCFLMHVNSDYVRHGGIDVDGFFTLVDVSALILPFFAEIPKLVEGFLRIIDLPACPRIAIREHCGNPYDCQMEPLCWDFLPDGNVLELMRGRPKGFTLIEQGVVLLKDIPHNFKLTDNQRVQFQVAATGREHIDRGGIAEFLKGLVYPVYFMDFETIFEVIPRFDGTSPYQQVPFQFSLHVQNTPQSPLEHCSFLYKGADDPRPQFAKELRKAVDGKGTVVVYHQTFEQGRLKEIADTFPEYAEWVDAAISRMVDLRVPFSKLHYYNPKQHGSTSIKKVLPALVGAGYEGMEIAEGGTASREYVRVTYDANADPEDKARVYSALEVYCALDTKAMVDIVEKLIELTK